MEDTPTNNTAITRTSNATAEAEQKWKEHLAVIEALEALPQEVLDRAIAVTARQQLTEYALLYHHATCFLMQKGLFRESSQYFQSIGLNTPPNWTEEAILVTARNIERCQDAGGTVAQ